MNQKEINEIEDEIASIKYYLEYQAGGNEVKVRQKRKRLETLQARLENIRQS